jgi:hypothetical protein
MVWLECGLCDTYNISMQFFHVHFSAQPRAERCSRFGGVVFAAVEAPVDAALEGVE